jgi:hypothetical protein
MFGTDIDGKPFSENLTTENVSHDGVKVIGLQAIVKVGDIVGMAYGANKGRFCVRWVKSGTVGLQTVSQGKPFWDFPLPAPGIDEFGRHSKANERRQHPRLKCLNSVELYPEGESNKIWGKAGDLGMGGCFVEMSMPLKAATKVKMVLWIRDEKIAIKGKVVSSRPGFGIGLKFTEIAAEDETRLKLFLQSITRLPV